MKGVSCTVCDLAVTNHRVPTFSSCLTGLLGGFHRVALVHAWPDSGFVSITHHGTGTITLSPRFPDMRDGCELITVMDSGTESEIDSDGEKRL